MWTRTDEGMPNSGEVVQIITESGMETELRYQDNLWWLPDMSMYVYYVPIFWKRMGS